MGGGTLNDKSGRLRRPVAEQVKHAVGKYLAVFVNSEYSCCNNQHSHHTEAAAAAILLQTITSMKICLYYLWLVSSC